MENRNARRLGRQVGVVGLGCWQLGADWGQVDESDALAVLHAAADTGVNFFDTADVYGDGRSETLVGRFLRERADSGITVATKMGRRVEQTPENYNRDNFLAWNDRSRANLGVDTLDLVQLHCPPTPVYSTDEVFDTLDEMVQAERIAAYGVSVETTEEALTAIARPGVASVQIILNALRLKPLERVLPAAADAGVAIIARVPLASGLLSGKYRRDTAFAADDHRSFNRNGEAFDVGETFSGVPYEVGLEAVERLRGLVPDGATMAQFALRWIIDQPGVTVVIPGARNAEQARANSAAASLAPLTSHDQVRAVYDELVRPLVHDRW
ncbi:aryl-alcohol dehydrogenase-like predicted oxidoreductase [Saccharothrix tamanrassetensis]|uniref:Aryl-alcohol dehydrogenase-like predicted oxidoreductase n=1 Tax=Saccharothrix tamanrassetensis TaxID=1051531 RepID=A0A841CHA5_9PSEU|nr:aldo/keto reductase [Saccharothrix tamanrassetensis]MBB5955558.1 aryl-alcohol dehydrogenase-like predicted oxidoreductase [Saccharothrix tamanrassetensis]